ncbi:Gfo/Idh/MocA family protein [Paracerasibacillus soli]
MQRLHELISKDVFGEIYFGVISMRLNRSESYFKSSSWKGTWEKDGGMLVNQGIHFIDLLIWLMGEPKSVYGELLRVSTEKEIEDIATGIITYQNGAKGLIEANTITKPNNIGYSLALFGSKGTICIGGKGFNQVKHCYVEGNHKVKNELTKLSHQTDEQHAMYEDFIQAIVRDQTNLVNPSEGKKALEAIFALYESHIENMSIPLPLESFSTEEMSKKVKGKEKDDD